MNEGGGCMAVSVAFTLLILGVAVADAVVVAAACGAVVIAGATRVTGTWSCAGVWMRWCVIKCMFACCLECQGCSALLDWCERI